MEIKKFENLQVPVEGIKEIKFILYPLTAAVPNIEISVEQAKELYSQMNPKLFSKLFQSESFDRTQIATFFINSEHWGFEESRYTLVKGADIRDNNRSVLMQTTKVEQLNCTIDVLTGIEEFPDSSLSFCLISGELTPIGKEHQIHVKEKFEEPEKKVTNESKSKFNCDNCNKSILKKEMEIIPNGELRLAVLAGYNGSKDESSNTDVDFFNELSKVVGISDSELERSFFEIPFKDKSDWGLCPTCYNDFNDFKKDSQNNKLFVIGSKNKGELIFRNATGGWFPYMVKLRQITDPISGEEISEAFGLPVFSNGEKANLMFKSASQAGKISNDYQIIEKDAASIIQSLVDLNHKMKTMGTSNLYLIIDSSPNFGDPRGAMTASHLEFIKELKIESSEFTENEKPEINMKQVNNPESGKGCAKIIIVFFLLIVVFLFGIMN